MGSDTGSDSTRAIIERLLSVIGESEDPEFRKSLEDGALMRLAEMYAHQRGREVENQLGPLLVNAIAMARPLPPQGPLSIDDLAQGVDVARAIRDLDRGRGLPCNAAGSFDRIELVQRLGDFIADADPDLYGAMRHAVFVEPELPEGLGGYILRRAAERWAVHVDVTMMRWAASVGSAIAQAGRAAKGGSAPRRSTAASSMLVAAVLAERPALGEHGKSMKDLVAVLGEADPYTWGDVTIDDMTIEWNRRTRRWEGEVLVCVGDRAPEPVSGGALKGALERAKKTKR